MARKQKVIEKISQKNNENYDNQDSTKALSSTSSSISTEEVTQKISTDGTRSNNMWKNITRMKQQQSQKSSHEEK